MLRASRHRHLDVVRVLEDADGCSKRMAIRRAHVTQKRNSGIVPAHSKLSIRHRRTTGLTAIPAIYRHGQLRHNEFILNCAAGSRSPTTRSPGHSRRRFSSLHTARRTLKPTYEVLNNSPTYGSLPLSPRVAVRDRARTALERPRSERATKICKSFLAPSSAELLSSVPYAKAG
jgi:hypothetical protein